MTMIPSSPLVADLLAAWPLLAALLATLLRAGLAWQAELSWPEYRLLHAAKRATFPWLQRLPLGFDSFVNEKGGRDDAEFLTTRAASPRAVVGHLRSVGGSLHLINSVKRRPDGLGDPLSVAHVVWTHGDSQTEAYLFANADGTTDVYAHYETSVTDPDGHLTDPQHDGDPRGVVREALAP